MGLYRRPTATCLSFPAPGWAPAGQQRDNPRKVWLSATRKAGLPGIIVHDLRRSVVRNMGDLAAATQKLAAVNS